MCLETSHLVPYENPLEQRSPLLPISAFNDSNNNFSNALYLLNAFLQGAQLVIPSPQKEEKNHGDEREVSHRGHALQYKHPLF